MKNLIIFTAICLTATTTSAQENVVVKYSVGNNYGKDMTLISNPQKSLYFNTMSEYVDSCESTPEGKAKLREIQLNAWRVILPDGTVTYEGRKLGLAPEKHIFLYVEKNRVQNELTVYDSMAGGMYKYKEPLDEITWEIVADSSTNILGLDCIMAMSLYHGRTWRVWFAPAIPVQDGPWKLRGLPGLILQADGGNGFTLKAKEIGISRQEVPPVYSTENYENGKRKKILADNEHYENNFESIMAAQGIKMNGDDTPAEIPKYNRQERDWETDY